MKSQSKALNHSANFHHQSQTTALFKARVLGSQGGTLYLLQTWLAFGVVPPCRGVITVTVTFFVLSHRRKKMESLFHLSHVRAINCVHFNYDLISEDSSEGAVRGFVSGSMCVCVCGRCVGGVCGWVGGWGGGWGVCWHAYECGWGWIMSRGHDLRMVCHWANAVPPKPWPSVSSNSSPPPEEHMHKNTHTHLKLLYAMLH